ncbi:hypothetical protein KL910_000968 [Ogataea haglerorum]|nr:hypothetical protein KL910_000968 [Ogataea haglerorum]KAG7793124.1 hypothetical protein KL945_000229 [Ogataea haglerorum]
MQLLSIQSHVAHGYVGNKAAAFPLQMLGWNVDVLNTVNFSNHTGYGSVHGEVVAGDKLADLYAGLCDINVQYDALLTGYIHGSSSLAAVGQMCKAVKRSRPECLWLLDPVMGDDGQIYVSEDVIPVYRQLVHSGLVDVITPNQLELELLLDFKIACRADLRRALATLHTEHQIKHVVVSSLFLSPQQLGLEAKGSGLVFHRRRRPVLCAAAGQAVQTAGRGAGDEPGAERDVARAGRDAADVRRKARRDGAGQARRRHVHEGVRAAHRRVPKPVPPRADRFQGGAALTMVENFTVASFSQSRAILSVPTTKSKPRVKGWPKVIDSSPKMLVPHGGVLQDLLLRDAPIKSELIAEAATLKSLSLTDRQLCDLELILVGGFSPLTGFLNEADYTSVVHKMRLSTGEVWPIPITLDVSKEVSSQFTSGDRVVLRDPRDDLALAILTVGDIYTPDKQLEAKQVFRGDPEHPAVRYLFDVAGEVYIGGALQAISAPKHYDYTELRKTPAQLRSEFANKHWSKVVAFQTRNPMHRAHRELTVRAARDKLANLLIHPVVGLTKPGDIDHHTRVKVYQEIIKKYPNGMAQLALLPLAMRMAGDREALWHSIIRKNYGATHFIVGRDHAGPGSNSKGVPFYGPYDAQELVERFSTELEIEVVPFRMVTYLPDEARYAPIDSIPDGTKTLNISGTELRKRLREGTHIPEWFSYPEVVKILRTAYPPRQTQGFALYLQGLPNSGVEALSYALQATFNQFAGGRHITLLDAAKIGSGAVSFVVGELVRSGAGVIVVNSEEVVSNAALAAIRNTVAKSGTFVVVSVETPRAVCEANDRKGYFQASRQDIEGYEVPAEAEIRVDLDSLPINTAIQKIVLYLEEEGFFVF